MNQKIVQACMVVCALSILNGCATPGSDGLRPAKSEFDSQWVEITAGFVTGERDGPAALVLTLNNKTDGAVWVNVGFTSPDPNQNCTTAKELAPRASATYTCPQNEIVADVPYPISVATFSDQALTQNLETKQTKMQFSARDIAAMMAWMTPQKLPATFSNVWYRTGEAQLLLAYKARGTLDVSSDKLAFVHEKGTVEIPLSSVKKVTPRKTLMPDMMNKWVVVQYRIGEKEEIIAFKSDPFAGKSSDEEIYSAISGAASATQRGNPPLNLIPMYGYPDIEKSAALMKLDEDFIKTVVGPEGSREEVSKGFAGEGWRHLTNGDTANAMRRFNQSWLLNQNNYQPYWGFGAVLLAQRKPSEAAPHFEKALSLINEESAKPRLLTDASRAYSAQGAFATDKMRAKEFFGRANSLLDEATKLDPKYGIAYRNWARSLYLEGNYAKAWDMVRKSRGLAGEELSSDFISMLSSKMPEPK